MARPTNTIERQKQIALGLMRVMAKKGYDGASVADIAKSAKLTTGLVHYHFDNKLEILQFLAKHLTSESLNQVKARLQTMSGNPQLALDALIDFYLGLGATARPEVLACWIGLSAEALRHRPIQQLFEAALFELKSLIKAHIDAGIRSRTFHRQVDADAAAAGVVAAIQGYFVLAGTARGFVPKGTAARTVKAMVHGVLKGVR